MSGPLRPGRQGHAPQLGPRDPRARRAAAGDLAQAERRRRAVQQLQTLADDADTPTIVATLNRIVAILKEED